MEHPILISGGDGFIGRSIVKRLLEQDYKVLVIDNHITSFPVTINKSNFERKEEDLSKIDLKYIPKTSGIIHLASVANPLLYKDNPSLVIDPNTLGTRKLIEIAKRDGVRILFASTSEVYGHLSQDLLNDSGIKETDSAFITLLSRRSCYAAAKRFGEELILNYKIEGGDASSFRLFNVYGKNMDLKHIGYGRVIPNFINMMTKEQPIKIFGDGTQIRSFLWIDDAVEAILGLYFYYGKLPIAINIGKDEPISIINLAQEISNVLKKNYSIINYDRDKDDPLWRKPNIDLIRKLINWEPKVSLEEGLIKIVQEK
jgi:UDP-glucuronate decarboxylase